MAKIKAGDKVRYIGGNHEKLRMIFPENGTVGTVERAYIKADCGRMHLVQWPQGATAGGGLWGVPVKDVERVDEDVRADD